MPVAQNFKPQLPERISARETEPSRDASTAARSCLRSSASVLGAWMTESVLLLARGLPFRAISGFFTCISATATESFFCSELPTASSKYLDGNSSRMACCIARMSRLISGRERVTALVPVELFIKYGLKFRGYAPGNGFLFLKVYVLIS